MNQQEEYKPVKWCALSAYTNLFNNYTVCGHGFVRMILFLYENWRTVSSNP
jgi:hypothetical protein